MFKKLNTEKLVILIFIVLLPIFSEEIGPLVINEIYPFSGKYGEWVELKNNSSARINLKGWQIADPAKTSIITYQDIFLDSGEVVLLLKSQAILKSSTVKAVTPEKWVSLNNDEDSLWLLLPYSELISDQVYYSSEWFESDGASLNRISCSLYGLTKKMWQSTVASPGYSFHFTSNQSNYKNSLMVTPLVMTPDNDGIDDYLKILSFGKNGTSINISIFDFSGRLQVEKNLLSGEAFNWSGKNELGDYVQKGPLFVVAKYDDGKSLKKEQCFGDKDIYLVIISWRNIDFCRK